MIIESGVIIFLGLLFLAIKLPTKTVLRWLGRPLTLDVSVSVIAYVMHYGTFSGIMAAAVAGLMTSAMSSLARSAIGFYRPDTGYTPGWFKDYSALYAKKAKKAK